MRRVAVLPSARALHAAVAERLAQAVNAVATAEGRCTLAMSGGSSAPPMLQVLATLDVAWSLVDVVQVDERVAPDGHADRNWTALADALAGTGARLHPMAVTMPDLDAAAEAYEPFVQHLDVVHLGLGPDGHCASLVPGDAVLEEGHRRVAPTAGAYQGRRRLTFTYPALARAALLVWHITGADKADAVHRLVAGDPTIPAGRVATDRAEVFADAAAAEQIRPGADAWGSRSAQTLMTGAISAPAGLKVIPDSTSDVS